MHRRNILAAALAGAGGLVAAVTAARAPMPRRAPPTRQRSSTTCPISTRCNFVLGNIRNHFDGMGGPDKVTISLVVHGPALKAFQISSASPDIAHRVGDFAKTGLELNACGNTMKAQKITLKDLLPGFIAAEQGGVVRIAELQSMGYVYLRP